jgi:hypothetical protein
MRRTALFLAASLLLGCAQRDVVWTEIAYQDVPAEPNEMRSRSRPAIDAGCAVSLRVAESEGSSFAAWWRVRPDSSAVLMVSRSMHGAPWQAAIAIDSSDTGVRGCGRPPPAIAADARSGYVHVAYYLEPASGAGVFFAHSMDSAMTFHSAVPIVFGNSPSRVSVDAHGDKVAVAFEDPNARQPMVGVSLSATMGHIFERRMTVSSPNGRARQPVVRLAGDSVRLWWSEYSANPAVSATRPAYRAAQFK